MKRKRAKLKKKSILKRILVFIGLKVIEISSFIFIPYGMGVLIGKIFNWDYEFDGNVAIWFIGLLSMFLIGIILFAIIEPIIAQNWKWSKKLLENKK